MAFSWQVGAARSDITAFIPGIVMLGYGNPKNTVKYVDAPLNTRVIWIENSKDVTLMVCLEVCFITQSLTDPLWELLQRRYPQLKRENILYSAQHTHSAPSGYSHYALYSMPTPGFSQEVLDIIVAGTFKAIVKAYGNRRPAKILYKEGQVPYDAGISFNRSIDAYNRNPEVKVPLDSSELSKATDRSVKILEFVDDKGPFASWNWFAVHCTNIIWTNQHISPGNKGYASLYLEDDQKRKHQREEYIAVFAQGNAGDVSPVEPPPFWAHWFKRDDIEMITKAKENGMKQFSWAARFLASDKGEEIQGDIDAELIYVDFSNINIEKHRLPNNVNEATTSPACFGVAFMEGAENAGVSDPIKWFAISLSKIIKLWEFAIMPFHSKTWGERVRQKYRAQAPKNIFVEAGEKKVLGTTRVMSLIIPGFVDKTIAYFKHIHKRGACHEHTWTQHVLPLSIIRIGSLSLIGVPVETTTMTGYRMHDELKSILGGTVIMAPYSQSFCGYITTPQEYEAQRYEGGHTVFGKWTQLAFSQNLARLAKEMLNEKNLRALDRDLQPPQFTRYELSIRKFSHASSLDQSPLQTRQ